MICVRVESVTKRFPGGGGLGPCDLEVRAGERFVLVGPSGAGKSTLLRLIAGLEQPDQGAIFFDNERIDRLPAHRRGLSFVPQRPTLLPHLNVKANLGFGARLRGDPRALATRIHDVAQILHIDHLLSRRPDGLSQGERQRVTLGRMLIGESGLWLLDEPFSALDFSLRHRFRDELHLLQREAKATMLYVTHDPLEALALADRIAVLADGIVRQVGTAEELTRNPGDLRVASCLGWPTVNLFSGSTRATPNDTTEFRSDDNSVVLTLPAIIEVGRRSLCIRPEYVELTASPDALPLGQWEPLWREPAGPATSWVLRRHGALLRIPHASDRIGDSIDLWVRRPHVWLFDEHTGARIRSD